MNDQLNRHLRILERLQNSRFSNRVSVNEVRDYLKEKGIDVSVRTVQRDMNALAVVFLDIDCHKNQDGKLGWFWSDNAKVIMLSGFSLSQALSFKLVKKYLTSLFPDSTLQDLQPFFEKADATLETLNDNALMKWPDKIAVVQSTQPLLPPDIDPECQKIISTALLENYQLKIDYVRLDGVRNIYQVNPLGLALRGHVIYLIATKVDTGEQRLFALHRVKKAEQLSEPAVQTADFNLNDYIDQGHLGFAWNAWNDATTMEPIEIKFIFSDQATKHLYETPLSRDQTITDYAPGYKLITATVRYTEQLVWWIRGYNTFIEVLEPVNLRNRIKQDALDLAQIYQTSTS
jgi:predicted DNA-binding transcriptional regulator YafY